MLRFIIFLCRFVKIIIIWFNDIILKIILGEWICHRSLMNLILILIIILMLIKIDLFISWIVKIRIDWTLLSMLFSWSRIECRCFWNKERIWIWYLIRTMIIMIRWILYFVDNLIWVEIIFIQCRIVWWFYCLLICMLMNCRIMNFINHLSIRNGVSYLSF